MKTCTKCTLSKPLTEFSMKKGRPGQKPIVRSRCKSCINEIHRIKYNKPRTKNKVPKVVIPLTSKLCRNCGLTKEIGEFHPECQNPTSKWHYSAYCKSCQHIKQKKYSKTTGYTRPSESELATKLIEAKWKNVSNGKHFNKVFSLCVQDIRSLLEKQTIDGFLKCATTGTILNIEDNTHPLYPSIDRIDNSIGYLPTNVRITSRIFNLARNKWSDEATKAALLAIANAIGTQT